MGRFIGADLPTHRSLWLIEGVAFAIGFSTTFAEPDVLVLAGQVEELSVGARTARELTYVIAIGVGLFVVGMNSSDSAADQISKKFTGRFTEGTTWYLLGGIVAGVAGVLMLLVGRKKIA